MGDEMVLYNLCKDVGYMYLGPSNNVYWVQACMNNGALFTYAVPEILQGGAVLTCRQSKT